jgi:hypothetical protein
MNLMIGITIPMILEERKCNCFGTNTRKTNLLEDLVNKKIIIETPYSKVGGFLFILCFEK